MIGESWAGRYVVLLIKIPINEGQKMVNRAMGLQ